MQFVSEIALNYCEKNIVLGIEKTFWKLGCRNLQGQVRKWNFLYQISQPVNINNDIFPFQISIWTDICKLLNHDHITVSMPYLELSYPLSRFLGFAKATKRFEPVLRFFGKCMLHYFILPTLVMESNFSIVFYKTMKQ